MEYYPNKFFFPYALCWYSALVAPARFLEPLGAINEKYGVGDVVFLV